MLEESSHLVTIIMPVWLLAVIIALFVISSVLSVISMCLRWKVTKLEREIHSTAELAMCLVGLKAIVTEKPKGGVTKDG